MDEDNNAFPNDEYVYHENPSAVEQPVELPLVDKRSSSSQQDYSVDGKITGAKRARSSYEEEEVIDINTDVSGRFMGIFCG